MRVLTDISRLRTRRRPVVLAAGYFDGLHRGHREVIDRTLARARRLGAEAWVLTFDNHPLKVLQPDRAPLLLTSNRHKLLLLSETDVDGCVMMPFTRALARLEPEEFVRLLWRNVPRLCEIFVGDNWRFGRGRRGTPAQLEEWGRRLGFKVSIVEPVKRRGDAVSSSRVRALLLAGDLREAERLLGRPFSILGTVVRGRSVGRRLGYPTANLDPHNEVLPPCGVYAVRVRLHPGRRMEKARAGVLNFGTRPTFATDRGARPAVEIHVLDLRRDLYGRDIEVFFLKKIRDERRFATARALSRRIALDIVQARRILARRAT
jgi:riboflavin kinase/FMN adenylyltransferase